MTSYNYDLPDDTSEASLLALIDDLNHDPKVNGILVQLPLPKTIDTFKILERIDPKKDVDGFHPYNLGCLAQRRPHLRPCTPLGIMHLLEHYDINVSGLHAIVVGASNHVGRPMALELLLAGSTITICHRLTRSLENMIPSADILVVAAGEVNVVPSAWIKEGAIVIDVGIHRLANGRLRGDIEFETAKTTSIMDHSRPRRCRSHDPRQTLLHNTLLAANFLKM